jgi:hypothetical protein
MSAHIYTGRNGDEEEQKDSINDNNIRIEEGEENMKV